MTQYPPYGPPPGAPAGAPVGAGWTPVYGAAYPGSLNHKGATTALTLGIISIVSLVLTPFCCITLPGVFCAPFAWGSARRPSARSASSPVSSATSAPPRPGCGWGS
jgi:hypothetical protein